MKAKLVVRAQLLLRQNRLALLFVAGWLAANAYVFVRVAKMQALDSVLVALCLSKATEGWPAAYQRFTEVVVFGLVASVIGTNITRKYRPEATSRELAAQARQHVVVVGYTNLGKRIVDLAQGAGKPVVVVESNAELVASLIREEDPLVIGSGSDRSVLEAASVAHARVVVIATDDLETAAVACRIVRELNASCELVVRCADDGVGAVLARTYRARALSTSRLAAAFIQGHALKHRVRRALVLGDNNVSARALEALAHKNIETSQVVDGAFDADLVVLTDDDLGASLLKVDQIREVNKRVRIICRAFHEDAAEILTRPPFDCVVFSTSRYAVESLVRAGVFRELGIAEVGTPSPRPLAVAS